MRLAKIQVQRLALHGGFEPDALDFQLALEPLVDSRDHIGHQSAGKTVERPRLPGFIVANDRDLGSLDLSVD